MSEDDDARAQQAFRDAFSSAADRLVPIALASPVRRRMRTVTVVVAAAAVVAALALGLGALGHGGAPKPPAVSTNDSATRWVSFGDVEVAVPATWGDRAEESTVSCFGAPAPSSSPPYVALNPGAPDAVVSCGPRAHGAARGFPPGPSSTWTESLSFATSGRYGQGVWSIRHYDGWTRSVRGIGDVVVALLTDDAVTDARRIRSSTRLVTDFDANGCAPSSDIDTHDAARPRFVSPLQAVVTVSVCQYGEFAFVETACAQPQLLMMCGYQSTSDGTLDGSRLLSGSRAQALVAAIMAAPSGGGPDAGRRRCSPTGATQVVVLHARDTDGAVQDFYVYYSGCHGNGIDDGATLHALTSDNCGPIWGGRVHDGAAVDAPASGVCSPQ